MDGDGIIGYFLLSSFSAGQECDQFMNYFGGKEKRMSKGVGYECLNFQKHPRRM
jgi:hypothetical protein